MDIYLVGYPKSKKIIPCSSYLVAKYVGSSFDINYLNFGKYTGPIFSGKFQQLGRFRFGGVKSWSRYIVKYLRNLDTEFLIFSLDDYLLTSEVNFLQFDKVHKLIESDKKIACIKLHFSSGWNSNNFSMIDDEIFEWNKDASYSVTTQWTLWRKDILIEILSKVRTPWEFEIKGSEQLSLSDMRVFGSKIGIFTYPTHSALSNRHPKKISIIGNRFSDVSTMIDLGILRQKDLILGQWIGNVPSYSEYKNFPQAVFDNCPTEERVDYERWLNLSLD